MIRRVIVHPHNHSDLVALCGECEKIFESQGEIAVSCLVNSDGSYMKVGGKEYRVVGFICPACLALSPAERTAQREEKIKRLTGQLLEQNLLLNATEEIVSTGTDPVEPLTRTLH